jgi:2'-5' RNA ligase
MRLFIGLNLPKKQRTRIQSAVRVLRARDFPVRWIDPDNFHITLKFLGEVRSEQVVAIEEALGAVASRTKAFSTELAGLGAFPTIRCPRDIWLKVGATPELRCMKQDIEWALGAGGFEAETRAFHPHISLGRADEASGAGAFRGLDTLMADLEFGGDLRVHTLDLMRSHLTRDRSRYSVIASARLAAG